MRSCVGTALLHKISDNIYAFGRIPSWIQGALSMPYGLYPQQKERTDVQDFTFCKSDWWFEKLAKLESYGHCKGENVDTNFCPIEELMKTSPALRAF